MGKRRGGAGIRGFLHSKWRGGNGQGRGEREGGKEGEGPAVGGGDLAPRHWGVDTPGHSERTTAIQWPNKSYQSKTEHLWVISVSARNGTDICLSEMCRPSSPLAGRRHLRSANRGQLVVPRYRLTTAGRRACCAGPSAWKSLPEYLTVDTLTLDYFKRSLKCFLFARYWHSHRRIYHWAMPPPFELRKISHMARTYNLREVAPVENH